tara:strand:+ start:1871 stop:2683 length:813 start_codon:yes stop_codon:yes gene_type:complete
VKGITRGVKKIFSAVGKVFKRITSSSFGKLLLAAVVVYTGGVAAGLWGGSGPLAFIAPAAKTATVASTGATAAGAGGTIATGAGAPVAATSAASSTGAIAGAGTGTTIGGAGAGGGALLNAGGASTAMAPVGTGTVLATKAAVPSTLAAGGSGAGLTAAAAPAGTGTVLAAAPQAAPTLFQSIVTGAGNYASSVGKFASANPIPAAMMMSGVAGAFREDPGVAAREARDKMLSSAYDNDDLRRISIFSKTPESNSLIQTYGAPMLQGGGG